MQLRIPIIDISEPSTNTADELISAAAKYGFVYIKSTGLGLNVDTLDRMFDIVGSYCLYLQSQAQYLG